MAEQKTNKGLIITVVILALMVLGLGGYIAYDKFFSENDKKIVDKEEEKKISVEVLEIDSDLVTGLVYPIYNFDIDGDDYLYRPDWIYKDITLADLSRDDMMFSAAHYARFIEDETGNYGADSYVYLASDIKKSFAEIFGPDTVYTDGSLLTTVCGLINYFEETENVYIAMYSCGETLYQTEFDNEILLYKAEKEGDYIYTYWYVQPYLFESEGGNYYFFDKYIAYDDFEKDSNDNIIIAGYKDKSITEEEMNSKFAELVENGEAATYKYTFKKQSDGNYYFYSGELQ